jgi:hypothetical protein
MRNAGNWTRVPAQQQVNLHAFSRIFTHFHTTRQQASHIIRSIIATREGNVSGALGWVAVGMLRNVLFTLRVRSGGKMQLYFFHRAYFGVSFDFGRVVNCNGPHSLLFQYTTVRRREASYK